MKNKQLSNDIKKWAIDLGFSSCGIAKVQELKSDKKYLKQWLNKNYNAEMHYMKNHFEKRVDPDKLLKGSKSVIVVLQNYYTSKKLTNKKAPQFSIYANGIDYHYVVKNKLYQLLEKIKIKESSCIARCFVDTAPILEKRWAQLAGLGWIGKNTCLITKQGSFYFIGIILTNLELHYDQAYDKNYCGKCQKCIDACPTNALEEPYLLNANKCLSYLTIEHKGELPEGINLRNQVFGCDICQSVCPHNHNATEHKEIHFAPNEEVKSFNYNDWLNLSESDFNRFFNKTAIKRTKYSGLKRNIQKNYKNK